VQWCHGAPGVVKLLCEAGRLDAALAAGEDVWRRGLLRKGLGLCHGIAGNAYAFLALHAATGERGHLLRALRFASFAADNLTTLYSIPDHPASLFEVRIGLPTTEKRGLVGEGLAKESFVSNRK
jgi:Lanthionine synthetase C-like protein